MRLTKSLLFGISALALATGAAFANEELSLTEPSTGQELIASYEVTSEGDVISSERFSEPMSDRDALAYLGEFDESASVPESESLVLSEPELIYYEETIVMVPSADTEMSLG